METDFIVDAGWFHDIPSVAAGAPPMLSTSPPKRRRGRPPKVVDTIDGQPSPAANLSAAVLKQGTPKASAPLMRVSPSSKRRFSKSSDSISSSPFQQTRINPSPKGGLLLKLNEDQDAKLTSKRAKRPRSSSKSNISRPNTYIMKTDGISLDNEHRLQSLVKDPLNSNPFSDISVNPSLLLSSPISSNMKFKTQSNFRVPETKASMNKTTDPIQSTSQTTSSVDATSPMTPKTSSSRFSSIIQSSPLYHGYYMNQSSPNTVYNSSPVKYQLKPIEDFKKSLAELPRNPYNSPSQSRATSQGRPTSPTSNFRADAFSKKARISIDARSSSPPSPTKEEKGNYKITLSIDEFGQAQITKSISPKLSPQLLNEQAVKRPKFTRHESLINTHQPSQVHNPSYQSQPPILQRSQSTIGFPSSAFSDNCYFEPLKMPNDSFFNEVNDINTGINPLEVSHSSFDLFNEEILGGSDENSDEFNDEDMTFDARKALIKMIRRSV